MMNDKTFYRMHSAKSIDKFHNDDGKVIKVVRPLSTLSPSFIGIIKDSNTNEEKIAFWITEDKKYATSDFKKSKKYENKYNVTLWKQK